MMSVIVTSAAIVTVRSTIFRYTGVSISSWKFWKPTLWTISPLKSSSCHSDAMNRTASEPRYAIRSQPTAPPSSRDTCTRGRRHRNLAMPAKECLAAQRARPAACASALDLRPGLDPLGVVLAHVSAIVAALLPRRVPVGHLVEEGLVVGVVGLA